MACITYDSGNVAKIEKLRWCLWSKAIVLWLYRESYLCSRCCYWNMKGPCSDWCHEHTWGQRFTLESSNVLTCMRTEFQTQTWWRVNVNVVLKIVHSLWLKHIHLDGNGCTSNILSWGLESYTHISVCNFLQILSTSPLPSLFFSLVCFRPAFRQKLPCLLHAE